MKRVGKRETLEEYLALGEVGVRLDARQPGVDVPEAHRESDVLALNLSHRYSPTPQIEITDWGFSATLSFARRPYRVRVPWAAVWALQSHVTGNGRGYPMPPNPVPVAKRRGGLGLVN